MSNAYVFIGYVGDHKLSHGLFAQRPSGVPPHLRAWVAVYIKKESDTIGHKRIIYADSHNRRTRLSKHDRSRHARVR